jgi:lipopolysaccharide transport system permease protein
MMMLIFTFFFGKKLQVPSENIPYPVFVFSGLLLWNVFSSGISSAGNSMINNANIIKKIYFPRLIIPISSVIVSLFDFLMALLLFVGVVIYYNVEFDLFKTLVFAPLGIIVTIIATLGMGTFLAALNIKYRDFRYIIPFLVQIMLFVTPVIYPISMVKDELVKLVLALNPMYSAITMFRSCFNGSIIQTDLLLVSLISGLLIFIVGLFYFRKTESYFADLV